jgi:hypothetical protein
MTDDRKKPTSATRSSGSFQGIYVPKARMEAVFPGAYELLPTQFRDRIPSAGRAHAANSTVLRAGFAFLQRFADDLFRRLQHNDGEEWEQWKLLVACYCIEREIGPNALRNLGQKVFSQVPKPEAKTVPDAIRGVQIAFQEQHGGMSPKLIGGWQIQQESPGSLLVDDTTFYPCALHEGLMAALCDTHAKSAVRYDLLEDPTPKRQGGHGTRYAVHFHA